MLFPLEFSFNVCMIMCVLIIVYKLFVLPYNPINQLKKKDSLMFLGILMSSDMERNRHIFTNLAIVLRLEET